MIGQTISHYRILQQLGAGGMGVVYEALDLKLDRTVALKFLPPELTRDPGAKERFVHEAKAASALQHNNICTVHDIDQTEDGQLFISMDCYEGETLKRRLEKGPLTIETATDLGIQVAQGLAEAHQHGIVHRDVKPANILITQSGVVKILDFGLAKLAGQTRMTRSGSTIGTAAYMSPEQARGEEVDQRTDIWSLGVMLYEMLSGQLPFRGEHEAALLYSVVNEAQKPLQLIQPGIPEELAQIVQKTLQKDCRTRYQDPAQLLHDLRGSQARVLHPLTLEHGLAAPGWELKRPRVLIPLVLIIVAMISTLAWYIDRATKIRWARDEALPQASRLVEEASINGTWARCDSAFTLAKEAEQYIPDDPALAKLWPKFTHRMTIVTTPPGARAYRKVYSSPAGEWVHVGTTPVERILLPTGYFRWKFVKEGFDTVSAVSLSGQDSLCRTLDTSGTTPVGMVRVSGGTSDEVEEAVVTLGDFFLDRYEVTNVQYKEFVEAGGYQNRRCWSHEFIKDGRKLAWEDARKEFVDATGRPGPATWQGGDYPQGQDQYPVSGVSWYEAAAYAEFVGKDLPTTHHWYLAAGLALGEQFFLGEILPVSNFAGSGPSRIGAQEGMNSYGASDMAGNVREWCWNESRAGRCVRGGAWDDIGYMYSFLSQAPAFDRSPKNGIRCALYTDKAKIPGRAFGSVDVKMRTYAKEKPVSDRIFQIYKDRFSYDKTDLNPVIEKSDSTSPNWIREKVTFDAAYGKERMIALLFLPRKAVAPWQTVVFFPGTYSLWRSASDSISDLPEFEFIVKSGRALVYPVYYGTYERNAIGMNFEMHWPSMKYRNAYTELLIRWTRDFSRTIDYIETRKEFDTSKLAFYGFSWGGRLGAVIPALDGRLKVSVLYLGGFAADAFPRPEADEFNYVSRIHIPTLMLNGRYDRIFPCSISVQPMYDLLGTPRKHKRLCLYDTDHHIERKDLIKETLVWLDQYLGQAR